LWIRPNLLETHACSRLVIRLNGNAVRRAGKFPFTCGKLIGNVSIPPEHQYSEICCQEGFRSPWSVDESNSLAGDQHFPIRADTLAQPVYAYHHSANREWLHAGCESEVPINSGNACFESGHAARRCSILPVRPTSAPGIVVKL